MVTIDITGIESLFGNTEVFGVYGLVGLIIAILIIFMITDDMNRIPSLFFPVLVALLIAGVKQNIFVLAIASIVFVIDSLSIQILGNYLKKSESESVSMFGGLFGK